MLGLATSNPLIDLAMIVLGCILGVYLGVRYWIYVARKTHKDKLIEKWKTE